jgi:hypothetical protein
MAWKDKIQKIFQDIFSIYGVPTLVFGLLFLLSWVGPQFCSYFYEWKSLAPVFLTAFSIFLLDIIRTYLQRAEIGISDIGHQNLGESIRIYAEVRNKGVSVAKYVKPLLTIKDESLKQLVYAEYSNMDRKWLKCSKDNSICTICKEENRKFLCPHSFKVEKEYLCWMVPEVSAGIGLDGKPYCHVTNIAPNDSQKAVIADVYRDEEERACVIKIADEYGIDWKPRICYKVDLNKTTIIRFTLEIVGEGFKPVKEDIELKIEGGELKVVFRNSEKVIHEFKEIKGFPVNYTRTLLRK